MQVTIHYNPESGAVWAQHGSYPEVFLRRPVSKLDAYDSMAEGHIVRTSDWLPAYGPVVACSGTIGELDPELSWVIETAEHAIAFSGTYAEARAEAHQFHVGATITRADRFEGACNA